MTDETTNTKSFTPPLYWLTWTLATATGWLGGIVINFLAINLLGLGALSAQLAANPNQVTQETALLFMVVSFAVLLVLGGSIGLLQWLVLRRLVPNVGRWALSTAVGFMAGSFAYPLLFMGIGVGLLQWLVLRRDLNKAGWWPLLSAVAWPVGYVAGTAIGSTGSAALSGLVSALISGTIIGALTGAMLVWLLRQNQELLEGLREQAAQARD